MTTRGPAETVEAPADFKCDTCSQAHQIPEMNVTRTPGNTLVNDMEAMAEVEHFAATGCRGRLSIQCDRAPALAALQAENAELRERLEAAERALEKPENWPIQALQESNFLRGRATAAEGERDRLRELLERARVEFKRIAELARVCDWTVMAAIAERAAVRAIPHTEGEASAPPKETE